MYAAPFGFMKDMGDGIIVVAIRSALIMDNVLYAYAGCGVVADSDADEEYAETNNKNAHHFGGAIIHFQTLRGC